MPPPQDRFTDYSAGPASYGRGRVSRTGLTGARGMQSPYRRTPSSNLTMIDNRPPGSPRVPDRTTGIRPMPSGEYWAGRGGGGQISTLMHGRPNITRPWPGPGGGGISAPPPSGEYGHGMGPMDADESNKWLNEGNFKGGGYATIQSLLAAENAKRWGDAPGEAPAGNQLNFGEVTPGSKTKHWTWGPRPIRPIAGGTGGTGGTGGGTGGGGPLTDPQTGLPLEDPQGNPVTGIQSGQAAPPTGHGPYPRSPMTYYNQNAGGRATRRRTAYGSSPYLNY